MEGKNVRTRRWELENDREMVSAGMEAWHGVYWVISQLGFAHVDLLLTINLRERFRAT